MRKAPVILLSILFIPVACKTHVTAPITSGEETSSTPEAIHFVEDPELEGLRIKLSEADAAPQGPVREYLPPTTPLDAARTAHLLARLPELQYDGGADFAMRSSSRPAPRPGETVEIPFPPDPSTLLPPQPDPGPLAVLRHAPEGEVPLAHQVSVTFNQPMVAVTSQEEASRTVPVGLQPQPEGAWRWIGTRTILFDPGTRMPMATRYSVTVPAGTKSASGDALAKDASWSFATPPLRAVSWTPSSGAPVGLEPVMAMQFDQAIDAQALLPFLSLTGGTTKHQLRLATPDEIGRDDAARALVASSQPDRVIALRASATLPKATGFSLVLAQGAPSAEGPLTTTSAQTFWFETYHPLRVEEYRCSWGDECPPDSGFWIRFNNPLDEKAFDPKALSVSPAMRHMSAFPSWQHLNVDGVKQGRTTYTVTLPASLADSFGQVLGSDQKLSFRVGPATSQLRGPAGPLVVLDPAGDPVVPVYTTNHDRLHLRAYRVEPKDWGAVAVWAREFYDHMGRRSPPPGVRVADQAVKVEAQADQLVETKLDLSPWLHDGTGQLLLWVEPSKQPREYWNHQYLLFWVQATDIGLSAAVDGEELIGWATDLMDGSSAAGVELAIEPGGNRAKTDKDGLARLALQAEPAGPQVLVARKGDDVAILPQHAAWWNDWAGWRKLAPADELRWFVFDDRGLYKPGETARIKGWVRRFQPGRGGDVRGLAGHPSMLRWTAYDPRYSEFAKGEVELSAGGGFDVEVAFPDDVNLGTGWVDFEAIDPSGLAGTTWRHNLQIQEFRRPEFEVTADADAGPHVLGGHATVEVEAKYFSGGSLPGAETTWRVYADPGTFSPPGRSDWSFGAWTPWWHWNWWQPPVATGAPLGELAGKTDGGGAHRLRIDFEALNPPRAMDVRAEATVTDVNRQAWTARDTLVLHPADLYVGMRASRPFYSQGDKVEIELIVVDLDGAAALGREVELTLVRREWERVEGEWKEVEKDPQTCKVASDDDGQTCAFTPDAGGSFRAIARIRDDEGRRNESELYLWVAGGKGEPQRGVEMQQATLIPSGKEFKAGDTAEILVRSPFAPAEGLMTLRRSGIVATERFHMDGSDFTLRIPITDAWVPDLTVQVDLVGQATRTDDQGEPLPGAPKRPAFASGSLQLAVPPLARTLALLVKPRAEALQPGEATAIDLVLKDASGKPASGEVAVVVVDESVLSLTGYRVPDPLAVFYAMRGPGAQDHYLRGMLLLADPLEVVAATGANALPGGGASYRAADDESGEVMLERSEEKSVRPRATTAMPAAAPPPSEPAADMPARAQVARDGLMSTMGTRGEGEMDKNGGEQPVPIEVRADFRALAAFEPSVQIGEAGTATVPFDLPDSLTRYRVMAVAVSGENQFGQGEATITARKPVQARPSPPRFLNFGDTFELPVVVQNQTDQPVDVEVAVRSVGFELTGPHGQGLQVAAGDRAEVRFPAEARRAGKGRFQVVVEGRPTSAGRQAAWEDAAEGELPIWTPATSEAFATYGTLDEGAMLQPVEAPPEVWPQFGGLEITTSSTALQALTDAVIYLVNYPFECSEQVSSRVLAIAALRDVLAAFEAEGLSPQAELVAAVQRDMERLKGRQRWNGGFGLWSRHDGDEWPYVSVHVMHSLARAREKGLPVPAGMIDSGLPYLRNIESYIPWYYGEDHRRSIRAYAVYVRELLGDGPGAKARELYREAGTNLPMEAQGWILPTLYREKATKEVETLLRHWDNRVSETAGAANFVTRYSDNAYLLMHSDRRTDGVLLEALIRVDPEDDLIPKVVRGLLAHKKRGHWGNTQEDSLILVALDRYFRTFESETPDFVARVWLGDGYAGDHAFVGRTTEYAQIDVPMEWLAEKKGRQDLVLQKDGDDGRLYYRIGMRYAPKSLVLEPADYGFVVSREYLAVDDPGDVRRGDDGAWHVKAGSRVRVRVSMVADSRRYHVALIDPLPAGLEPINPELQTSETLPPDVGGAPERHGGNSPWYWWWGPWYEHDNLRDERVEAFTSLLWEGVYEYTYVARATTPGNFVVPPPKAEEMYAPETFGRGGTDRVIVE